MKPNVKDFDPVYLDRKVLAFLKAWPNDLDAAMYDRLYEARVIATPFADVAAIRGGPALTHVGHCLREMINETFRDGLLATFFPFTHVIGLWSIPLLANRRGDVGEFLTLFGLDWNTPDVRKYIAKGLLAHPHEPWTFGICDQPTRAYWIPPLEDLFEAFGEALAENRYQRRLKAYADGLDDDIPF